MNPSAGGTSDLIKSINHDAICPDPDIFCCDAQQHKNKKCVNYRLK